MTTIEVEETYTEEKTMTETVSVCEHCGMDDSDEVVEQKGPMLLYTAVAEGDKHELDADDESEAELMERFNVSSLIVGDEFDGDAPDLHFHADCLEAFESPYDLQYTPDASNTYIEGSDPEWYKSDSGDWFRVRTEVEKVTNPLYLSTVAVLCAVLGAALPFVFEGMFTGPFSPFPFVLGTVGGIVGWVLFACGVLFVLLLAGVSASQ